MRREQETTLQLKTLNDELVVEVKFKTRQLSCKTNAFYRNPSRVFLLLLGQK
jgi:hypothetical protein